MGVTHGQRVIRVAASLLDLAAGILGGSSPWAQSDAPFTITDEPPIAWTKARFAGAPQVAGCARRSCQNGGRFFDRMPVVDAESAWLPLALPLCGPTSRSTSTNRKEGGPMSNEISVLVTAMGNSVAAARQPSL